MKICNAHHTLAACNCAFPVQVSLPIVRQFVKSVEETALGVKVLKGVRPDQQLVKVVNDQLIELMGGQQEDLNDPKQGPQVPMSALHGNAWHPMAFHAPLHNFRDRLQAASRVLRTFHMQRLLRIWPSDVNKSRAERIHLHLDLSTPLSCQGTKDVEDDL